MKTIFHWFSLSQVVVQHTLSSKWQVARDKNNIMNQKPLELLSANEGNSISVMLQKNRQKSVFIEKLKKWLKWTQAEHRRQTVSLSTDSTFKRFTEWPTLFPTPCYLTISDDEVRLMPVFFLYFHFFPFFFFFLLFNRCHRHSSVEFFLPVLIWNKLHLFRRNVCNIIYIFDKQNWQQKAP